MSNARTWVFLLAPMLLGAVACSSGTPSATATTTATTTATSTPSPTTSTAPSPTGRPDTTCRALVVAKRPGNNAASGRIYIVIEVRNASESTCVLNGYPTFQVLSAASVVLPIAGIQHGGSGPAPLNASPAPVTLPPGDKAGFLLMYWNRSTGGDSCPAATTMTLTSPGPFPGTVDLLACSDQSMNVSPWVIAAGLPSF